jgi:hypothetical protein
LGVIGITFFEFGLGNEEDVAKFSGSQGGAKPGDSAADDEGVGENMGEAVRFKRYEVTSEHGGSVRQ